MIYKDCLLTEECEEIMVTATIFRLWRMSLQGSVLILVILAARRFLKQYSKIYSYSLWILALISLLCPIMVSSPFSLQPALSNTVLFSKNEQNHDENFSVLSENMQNITESPTISSKNNDILDTDIKKEELDAADHHLPLSPFTSTADNTILLCVCYLIGISVAFLWHIAQYFRVRRQIACAVYDCENIWLCERVSSPFVIGIYKPRILLPYSLNEPEKSYILRHERTHIRHCDPLVRFAWLICVCLHWWNPLVWLASRRMEQDMEMFCDESTLQHANFKERKAYAETLLSCAGRYNGFVSGPAFGESNTKRRVENIMKKRKNNFIVLFCVILLAVFCAVAFMTIPRTADSSSSFQEAPVYFRNFAVSDTLSSNSSALPTDTNFFAVYHNKLYYAAENVGENTGEVEENHLTIYRCDLDGSNTQKILELNSVYFIECILLRDDFLYCSYMKSMEETSATIAKADISGTAQSEYKLPDEILRVEGIYSDCIYYTSSSEEELIFYTYNLNTQKTKELYRCSGYFLESLAIQNEKTFLLLSDGETCTLLMVDENQNAKNCGSYKSSQGSVLAGNSVYCSIDHNLYQLDKTNNTLSPLQNILPESIKATSITIVQEEENNLYYIVTGEQEKQEGINKIGRAHV